MTGSPLHRIFVQEDLMAGEVDRELEAVMRREHRQIDGWYLRKDGSRFWALGQTMPLLDEAGAIRGLLKIMCDHSNERQRLLDLEFAAQTKDAFIATLAHELRNPLAPIVSGLGLIRHSPGDARRIEETLSMLDRQVGQLSRLVDDLLDVSRVATGKLDIKLAPLDLEQVLSMAAEMSRPHVEAARHELQVRGPLEPVQVMGDTQRLAQVFANLLNNAARYTPPGGRIDLSVEAWPGEVAVRVRDTGIGIEPELIGQVFGMFRQLPVREASRRPVAASGLGIGLALVEGIVRLHGGRVEARSEGPGHGSEFTVILPRLGQGVSETPAGGSLAVDTGTQAGAAQDAAHPRILVVDDNIDAASTVSDLLSLAGAQVETVHRGSEAVHRTFDFHPQIVLLDIGLPDISGYEVARRIRQSHDLPQPTLIALTGWGQQQDKEMAAQAGFDQHWTKPVDPQRLLALASPADPHHPARSTP